MKLSILLKLAFLFFVGSVLGWALELVFRRFFSKNNPERKWINPGFCTGPYLPLYGFGLCILYLVGSLDRYFITGNAVLNKIILLIAMSVCMTIIEYIAGVLSLSFYHVRLWDYSNEWGNLNGIICPKFSLIWAILGAIYYLLIHPRILNAIDWLARNLAFSFFVGLFFGIFIIDAANSLEIVAKIKKFADENQMEVRYESLKIQIRKYHEERAQRYRFFNPFHSEHPLREHLKDLRDSLEQSFEKR